MAELDLEGLTAIQALVERRLRWVDRRELFGRLGKLMSQSAKELMTVTTPAIMAGPRERSRKSLLALEASLQESEGKVSEEDARRMKTMETMRVRTRLLKAWLDKLST